VVRCPQELAIQINGHLPLRPTGGYWERRPGTKPKRESEERGYEEMSYRIIALALSVVLVIGTAAAGLAAMGEDTVKANKGVDITLSKDLHPFGKGDQPWRMN
jgi:hypothetical protein